MKTQNSQASLSSFQAKYRHYSMRISKPSTAISSSAFIRNRLTKPHYSLNETGMTTLTFKEEYQRNKLLKTQLNKQKIHQCRISSFFKSNNKETLKNTSIRKSTYSSQQNILMTQSKHVNSFNSLQLKQKTKQDTIKNTKKFTLIIKKNLGLNKKQKTMSQRIINKSMYKIAEIKKQKARLQALFPRNQQKVTQKKRIAKGQVYSPTQIQKTLQHLLGGLSLYFGLYKHDNIVASKLKQIDGYCKMIGQMIMINEGGVARALQSIQLNQLKKYFWVFKSPQNRPFFFGEEDALRYRAVHNFVTKLDLTQKQAISSFASKAALRRNSYRASLAAIISRSQSTIQHKINQKLNKFFNERYRVGNPRLGEYTQAINECGRKINLPETNRDKVLCATQRVIEQCCQQ